MRTINDMLTTKHGTLSAWSMWANESQRLLWRVTSASRATRIPVTGFSMEEGVTVQQFVDGELAFCNHDGATEGTQTAYAGDDIEFERYAINCNKCDAWYDQDGGLYE